ncbi:MAG: hypothetical protein D8M59_07335 [Planctomycetes bacterium]|nr:hypothetical protein [Planctomycetota bacterium]NOG53854.1 hypothetical protein [Planctomycetota bacterium]
MTHNNDPDNPNHPIEPGDTDTDVTAVERLIERLIDPDDGCDTSDSWNKFRALASQDHGIWQQLAEAQQAHRAMCAQLQCALEPALSVSLPGSPDSSSLSEEVSDGHLGWMRRHAGWAAAIAVAVLWGGSSLIPSQPGLIGPTDSLATNTGSPDGSSSDAASAIAGRPVSTASGDLVGQTEPVLLDMRRRADGTMEVVYGHWVVERSQVDQFYNRQWDETGRPVDTPQPEAQAVPANFW